MRAPRKRRYVSAELARLRFPRERLATLFAYDPESGEVTLIETAAGRRRAVNNEGYVGFWVDGAYLLSHRIAWCLTTGAWPDQMLDHIDRDRTNNRWANLRLCDLSLNAQNVVKASRTSTSGLLGAHVIAARLDKGYARPYRSAIVDGDGKRIELGAFATAQEAHEAYMRAKAIYHPLVQL